jgi:hypothetical protein
METTAAKVVGPRDGQAGFLGSIGVRGPGDGWGVDLSDVRKLIRPLRRSPLKLNEA